MIKDISKKQRNYKFINLIEAQDLLSHGTPVIVLKEDYSNITFYIRIDNNDVKLLIINKIKGLS